MAIDSAKKRKSIAAIGLMAIGPVVVPDASINAADRQVVGYSYSGIAAGEPVDNTATYVCVNTVTLARASASIVLARASATVSRTECS